MIERKIVGSIWQLLLLKKINYQEETKDAFLSF